MILIPEKESVIILVPRTGSGSLYRAVKERYPNSMMLYRHMEASGVPKGYDRWQKFGIVRHPVNRIWSLYNYQKKLVEGYDRGSRLDPLVKERYRRSVSVDFEEFLLLNSVVFPQPYENQSNSRFSPFYMCDIGLPENRKSQYHYLRPDLGTNVIKYENDGPNYLASIFDLDLEKIGRQNVSDCGEHPKLSRQAARYCYNTFSWEFAVLDYRLAGAEL